MSFTPILASDFSGMLEMLIYAYGTLAAQGLSLLALVIVAIPHVRAWVVAQFLAGLAVFISIPVTGLALLSWLGAVERFNLQFPDTLSLTISCFVCALALRRRTGRKHHQRFLIATCGLVINLLAWGGYVGWKYVHYENKIREVQAWLEQEKQRTGRYPHQLDPDRLTRAEYENLWYNEKDGKAYTLEYYMEYWPFLFPGSHGVSVGEGL